MDLVIGLIIIIIIVLWLINSASKPKSKKELNEEALKIFGETKEERFKNIITFFDKKMGKIECDIDYKSKYSRIRKTFERNLKTLDRSERDALVTAYLLYNEDFMGDKNFYLSRFALLYGEGNGQLLYVENPKRGENDLLKLPEYANDQHCLSWLINE